MMKFLKIGLLTLAASLGISGQASAFCGFYVAKADTKLFNDASKVVLVREGDKTVITMANDYSGEPTDFAMVVPVPNVPQDGDIRLSDNKMIEHLDAYTAPRLVEYFDRNPCEQRRVLRKRSMSVTSASPEVAFSMAPPSAKSLGVKIEAEYTVGEYDIQILSALESSGLLTFLNQSGYKVPAEAVPILNDYIAKGMKFFVAKVNLGRHSAGVSNGKGRYLTPLQIRMTSKKFMLPIRLGTVNARGDQELFVFAITRKGRVVGDNYPTVKLPSNVNIPPFTEKVFGRFYQDMFSREKALTPVPAISLESAWDMSLCDPCAANPPEVSDLVSLGADWLGPNDGSGSVLKPRKKPNASIRRRPQAIKGFITRLHVRYNSVTFPNDLEFRVTDNRENFQGRYILQQPYLGEMNCEAAGAYRAKVAQRNQDEAIGLSRLTGWSVDYIQRQQSNYPGKPMNERSNQR